MKLHTKITATIAIGAGALLAIAAPLAASAHVEITPNAVAAGSDALITFNIPNESVTTVTDKIEVDIPTDTPFPSVSYVPVAGWTVRLVAETLPKPVKIGNNELKEAVTKVIWTAQPGAEIQPGQLQLFPIAVESVPDTGKIVLKALQSYSDGTVVQWVETTANAEHPAPVLYVNDAPADSHTHGTPTVTASGEHSMTASASSADALARGLGIGGLVLGAVGIALALATLRRKASS
ncbi:MAG: YcnI family copper-binding membrane protein [Lacisediminihabitans sp.]